MATPKRSTNQSTDNPLQVFGRDGRLVEMSEPEPNYDPGMLPDDPTDMTPDLALTTALQQLGEDESASARIIIYRMKEEKGKQIEEYLFETTPQEFAVEGIGGIQRQYGGGMYRARVFIAGERGFRTQKVFRIAEPKEPPIMSAQAGLAGVSELAAAMTQGFQQLGTLIAQTAQRGQSKQEMLQEMMMYKELFGSNAPASQGPDFSIMMDLFKQGMELGRMGSGEPSSMDVLSKAVDTFAPIAQAVIQNRTGPARPGAPAGTAIPAVPPVGHVPALSQSQPQEATGMDFQQMQLKAALSFIVKQAQANADPYTYACMVVDNVPEDELRALIVQPDWVKRLGQIEPGVLQPELLPWLESLKVEVMGILTPESETGNTPAHAGINSSESEPN